MHNQTMCITLLFSFTELCPLVIFGMNSVSPCIILIPSKMFSRYLVQMSSVIRQCADNKNHYFTYIFYDIMPLCIFRFGNVVGLITPKAFEIFLRNLVNIQGITRQCAEIKNYNSTDNLYGAILLRKFQYKNRVRSVTIKTVNLFLQNLVQIQSRSPSADMQRTRTITPLIFLTELNPSVILSMAFVSTP